MVIFKRAWLVIAILAFGCTMISERQAVPPVVFKAPDLNFAPSENPEKIHAALDGLYEKDRSSSMLWWVRYQQARHWMKHDPKKACALYEGLAQERQFPAREIAHLHAVRLCPADRGIGLPDFAELRSRDWLRDLAVEAEEKAAEADSNRPALMDVYHEKSKWSLNKKYKLEMTAKALEIARELNDEEKIQAFESRLVRLSPRLKKDPSRADRLGIADDHRYHREFEQAKRIYTEIINDRQSTESQIYRAHLGMRKTHKLERNNPAALQATQELAKYTYGLFKKNPKRFSEWYKDSILLYARTAWTAGSPDTATKLLRGLSDELKGLTPLDEVYWIRGRIEEEAKRYLSATRWFDRALAECKSCPMENRILWYKAWNLRKVKNHQAAKDTLAYLAESIEADEKPRVLFWQAKVLGEMGRGEEARELFLQTREIDPFGYYGVLAEREVGGSLNALRQPAAAKTDLPAQASFLQSNEGLTTAWLLALNEKELARKYLNEATRPLIKKHADDIKFWHEVFTLYAKADAYQSLVQRLWQIPAATRNTLLRFRPDILFPRPFSEIVSASGSRFGIPQELIYAIMRQESAFDHEARSPADAFGLMQMIPTLAERVAGQLEIKYEKPEDLYDPRINIPLGSAHLKTLWNKYNGQFILLTASYNASERAIRNWVQHRFEGDPLQFIEDVPYAETQKYIKLVLRNFVLYQRLHSETPEVPFPEWCLENIHPHNI